MAIKAAIFTLCMIMGNYGTLAVMKKCQQDIDSVMNILHATMNTAKATIRIAGEDKPGMLVVGKLMKLHNESIMYAIEKY